MDKTPADDAPERYLGVIKAVGALALVTLGAQVLTPKGALISVAVLALVLALFI